MPFSNRKLLKLPEGGSSREAELRLSRYPYRNDENRGKHCFWLNRKKKHLGVSNSPGGYPKNRFISWKIPLKRMIGATSILGKTTISGQDIPPNNCMMSGEHSSNLNRSRSTTSWRQTHQIQDDPKGVCIPFHATNNQAEVV